MEQSKLGKHEMAFSVSCRRTFGMESFCCVGICSEHYMTNMSATQQRIEEGGTDLNGHGNESSK